jgi:predicted TIM-barrel fold metal-dependent hydrolase
VTRRWSRRDVLGAAGAAAASALLPGCRGEDAPGATPRPGPPLESLQLRGYAGLTELPWFERGPDGAVRVRVDDLPPGVDFHAHLAMRFLFAPPVDLLRGPEPVRYVMACDDREPPCVVDLDRYLNHLADAKMLGEVRREMSSSFLLGGAAARTHTIPNLLAEMDRCGVETAVLLAIAPGFPFRDELSQLWLDAVAASGESRRLVVYGSVHPRSGAAGEQLRALHRAGIRGVKLHPTMQRFHPDDPEAMALYEVCRELAIPVFFHAGRAGIEPGFMQDYATLDHYVAPAEEFPDVDFVFGHAGARDVADALPVARDHPNVWMDVQGQGVTDLRRLLSELGPERLVFGTDWPWYPIAVSLAKLLIATDGDSHARDLVFSGNARRLLAGK